MSQELRPASYVGVSGVARIEQHGQIVDLALREGLLNDDHFVMIGIQATSKTQILGIENKRGHDWHPVGDAISFAAGNEDSGLTKPYVHCFFENDYDLEVGLGRVMHRTIHYAQGIQLNLLPWMDTDYRPMLREFKDNYPSFGIVLEVHRDILQEYSPQQVALRLGKLPVDYALFDASHGFGKELDVAAVHPFIDALYDQQLPIGAAVAGGLDAESLERLFAPLLAEYDDLSCDAEGKLRDGAEGSTTLDIQKVSEYLHAWKAIQYE